LAGLPAVAAVTLALVVVFLARGRDRRLLYLPASALSAWGVTMLLKVLFARYRPPLLFDEGLYGFGFGKAGYWYNSVPSGHAATAFGFLVALALARPRWRLPCIAGAAVLGLSRVLANAHFLSDVLAGALLGTTAALMFARLFIPQEA
jgi:membrane-associated phospholipid phosphatase